MHTSTRRAYNSNENNAAAAEALMNKFTKTEEQRSLEAQYPMLRYNVEHSISQRQHLLRTRKSCADLALYIALLGLLLMVCEIECTQAGLYSKSSVYSTLVKSVLTVSTLVLLGLIVGYHALELKLYVTDHALHDWKIALTWKRVAQLGLELLICAVQPIPGEFYFEWAPGFANDHPHVVSLDVVLSLPMFLRLYLCFRVLLLHTKLFTDVAARSVGAFNRINFDTRFAVKTLMTISPGRFLLCFTLTLWLLAAWMLRQCEGFHNAELDNFLNAMWLIAITFLTVGYGDMYPQTYCGRGIAVSTGILGAGCTALLVAVITRKLALSEAEKHVYDFVEETKLKKALKTAAANVLRETWLLYKYSKLEPRASRMRIRAHERRFLAAVQTLRSIKIGQRKLRDNAHTVTKIARTQIATHDAIQTLSKGQLNVDARLTALERKLDVLREQLDDLPNALGVCLREQYANNGGQSQLLLPTSQIFFDAPKASEPPSASRFEIESASHRSSPVFPQATTNRAEQSAFVRRMSHDYANYLQTGKPE